MNFKKIFHEKLLCLQMLFGRS